MNAVLSIEEIKAKLARGEALTPEEQAVLDAETPSQEGGAEAPAAEAPAAEEAPAS